MKFIVRAAHENGYVKCALVRNEADVASTVEGLEVAGHWLRILVEPFVATARTRRVR